MKQIDVETIRKSLESVIDLFDPDKNSYQIINTCINNKMSAEEMLDNLSKVGNNKEYPQELQDFFYDAYNNLKDLSELDKKIEETFGQIQKENKDLEAILKDKSINFDSDIELKEEYKDAPYEKKKEYLSELERDLESIKEKKSIAKEEKKSGEKFDEGIEKEINRENIEETEHNQEIKEIQDQAEKNIVIYTNPLLENVKNYVNYAKSNEQTGSELAVEIVYNTDGVELNLGYKGEKVNENHPLMKCKYDNVDYFNEEIYPYLIEEHIMEGGVKGVELNEEGLESVNVVGQSLEIRGNKKIELNAKTVLDEESIEYVDDENYKKTNKNSKVLTRKLENINNVGKGNDILLMILILIVSVFIVLALIFFL